MNVSFVDDSTWYAGRREPTLAMVMDGREFLLSQADMKRCATAIEHCRAVLTNTAAQCGADRAGLSDYAVDLQAHCRRLTKWKPATEIRRDAPRRSARRFAHQ